MEHYLKYYIEKRGNGLVCVCGESCMPEMSDWFIVKHLSCGLFLNPKTLPTK
jgi:hypothetical protein